MVKRKVDMSLDEWLERGVVSSHTSHVHTKATMESRTLDQPSTVSEAQTEVKAQLATGGPTDVAEPEGDNSNWFWLLLEQSGYERW